ncbi:hypothetical protein FB451DRAFT_177835 [Mycena latifolia]|nr:hypothetical protein FB451DRAFT_177835 [Mycena latifolia]
MAWNPFVIVDTEGRIVAALIGRPKDAKDWDAIITEMCNDLRKARHDTADCFHSEDLHHRRGNFACINCGTSFGQGQECPCTLRQSHQAKYRAADELSASPALGRVAGWQSKQYGLNFPKKYNEYAELKSALKCQNPKMRTPYPKSVFCACTYNLGPQTCCDGHRDCGNKWDGGCAITAGGDFDHTRGGHIVLEEFKLVIQFPSGSTVIIPSAVVTHSNTPIAEHEQRFSFTQYTAGGLFRWVEYGHRTEEGLKKKSFREWVKLTSRAAREARVARGLDSFSKYDDLVTDRKGAFPLE